MVRVSNYAASMQLTRYMLDSQSKMEKYQMQINSGKISQSYTGISSQSQLLVNMENSRNTTQRFIQNNQIMGFRLQISEQVLEGVGDVAKEFLNTLRNKNLSSQSSLSEVSDIQKWAFDSMSAMQNLLNTKADGRYIYSGTRSLTPPVDLGLTTLDEFQAKYNGDTVSYSTTRSSHLTEINYSKDTAEPKGAYVDASNWLTFREDADGITLTNDGGSIEATSAIFSNVAVGSNISITDSTNNNGTYTIASVSSDGTTVNIKSKMLTDERFIASIPTEAVPTALGAEAIVSTINVRGGGNHTDTLTFNPAGTITTAGAYGGVVSAGDVIEVTGTASNNGTYVVANVVGTVITLDTNQTTITSNDGTVFSAADFGSLTFGNSIVASIPASLTGIAAGSIIELNNTFANDGLYTVEWNSGAEISIKPNSYVTIEHGHANTPLVNFGDISFDRATKTITADIGTFDSLKVGDALQVGGTGENNGRYIVSSIAADGSSLTVETSTLTDEGLSSGNTFFNYAASSKTVFDSTTNTIQAQNSVGAALANAYETVLAGDTITVAGSTVAPALHTQTFFTNNGSPNVDTIQIRQSDGVTPVTGTFSDFQIGDDIVVANSTGDNGSYTINSISEDGSTITVNGDLPAATGVADAASASFTSIALPGFSLTTQNQVAFTGPDIIQMENVGAALIPNAFDDMSVGMEITLGGGSPNAGTYRIIAVNPAGSIQVENLDGTVPALAGGPTVAGATISAAGNDGTFTVDSVSADKSTITVKSVTPIVANQTDTNGTTVSRPGFSVTTGTRLYVDAATDQVRVVEKSSGTVVANAFDDLRAGQRIALSGTTNNNLFYTIGSIVGGSITTNENITASESDPSSSISVYSTTGTIRSNSYYSGDNQAIEHRLDKDRSFNIDLNAVDPAFEKIIRAMAIIAQGAYDTEGGLDQNASRIEDAKYLLISAKDGTITGTPPYGEEITSSLYNITTSTGLKRSIIEQTTIFHNEKVLFTENEIASRENADPLEAVTNMLNESNALEAAYQAMGRIQGLSLANYLN